MSASLRGVKLHKSIRDKTILDQVDLALSEGEIVGLLGPNGAGKTTAFSILAGVIRGSRGGVFLDEQELTTTPLHQRARLGVTYIPQDGSVFQGMTVCENLLALPRARGEKLEAADPRFQEVVKNFNLANCLGSRGSVLSGGERKRVEIARALLHGARFLLLDEPYAGLDPHGRADLSRALQELRRQGKGVFLTDHRFEDVLNLSDRVYVLAQGRTISAGVPSAVRADAAARSLYFEE